MPSRFTCPFCGATVSAEARYCDHCGTPLAQAPVPPRRQADKAPIRITVWAFMAVLVALFGIGILGGFRSKADRWPWTPAQPAAAATEVTKAPPPQRPPDNSAVLRSVVSINVRGSQGNRTGSGFLLDAKGHVVTVAHVLEGLQGCVTVLDDNGKPHQGKVAAQDRNLDIALLDVPTLLSWPTSLAPGESAGLTSGDTVFVMGTPKGAGNSTLQPATFNRTVTNQRIDSRFFRDLLQISGVLVLEGSSGGPLVERSTGRVVGIVVAGSTGGIGYAIPMGQVRTLLQTWASMPSAGACATEASVQTVPAVLATITPLSGQFGVWGADIAYGAELALRDMETDLRRVGYEVTLHRYDDQGSAATAGEAARMVDYDQGVIGVVGSLDSQVTRTIANLLKGSRLPVVAPMAGAEDLTAQNWPHFNRLVANSGRQEQAAARFAQEKLKVQAIFLLDDGSLEADAQARGFETAAQVISLPVLQRATLGPSTDYAYLKRKIAEAGVDGIYYAGMGDTALKAIQALRQEGVTLPIMGGESLYDPRLSNLLPREAQGVYFTHLTVEASEQFQRHFESALGKPTRGYAAYGYDAARVLLEALVRYGEANPARLPGRAELAERVRQTKGYPGRAASVTFDEFGDNRTSWVYVFEWKQGKPELRDQLQ